MSVRRRARALASLFIALASLFALAPASADTLSEVKSRGVLRWGGDMQGGEPYVSQEPSGKLVGFEVDLAAALALELGVRAEFVQADWSALVASLERGTFDVAMNGLEVTAARRARLLFTRPYYAFALRLVARSGDDRFTSKDAKLGGLRVGTLTASLSDEHLRAVGAEVVLYEGVQEPYFDLTQKRTDAVLLDDIIAKRYGEGPGLRVVGDLAEGSYAIGLRRTDAALKGALDDALARVMARGELEAILRRHGIWNERQRARPQAATAQAATGAATETSAPRLTVGHARLFLRGAAATLLVTVLAMAIAIPLGLVLALLRLFGPRAAGALSRGYVEIFRGTPVLLQLYVLYFGLAPVIKLSPLTAAVLGLGLNYGAYEAEVARAAILSVPKGQYDAAAVLGMAPAQAFRSVIFPQALRVALPGTTNDFIALLKDSSLVSVITVVELTKQMTITAVDVRGWLAPGLLCAAMYFAMSYPLSRLSSALEARLARGRA